MYERTEFYEQVKERLIRYAKVDTQSDLNGKAHIRVCYLPEKETFAKK